MMISLPMTYPNSSNDDIRMAAVESFAQIIPDFFAKVIDLMYSMSFGSPQRISAGSIDICLRAAFTPEIRCCTEYAENGR